MIVFTVIGIIVSVIYTYMFILGVIRAFTNNRRRRIGK